MIASVGVFLLIVVLFGSSTSSPRR